MSANARRKRRRFLNMQIPFELDNPNHQESWFRKCTFENMGVSLNEREFFYKYKKKQKKQFEKCVK